MRLSTRLCATVPLALLLLTACSRYHRPDQPASQLAFGVDMARHGLWNEAMFRFREAERLDPNNARVENNLGVAYEAAGEYDKALDYYKKALKIDPNSKELRANYARFVEFYQGFKPSDKAASGAPGTSLPAAQPADHRPPETNPPAGAPVGVPEPTAPGPPPPPPV